MNKSLLHTFLPWILYCILAGNSVEQTKVAITVAAIVTIIVERKRLMKKFILSWATLLFFVFMFLMVVIKSNVWVMVHAWILSHIILAFVVWFSVVIKRPFTVQYAKETVAQDKWLHPVFLKINYLITTVWGIIFTIGLLVNLFRLYNPDFSFWLYELLTDGAIIFGIWFSATFPDWYKSRLIKLSI